MRTRDWTLMANKIIEDNPGIGISEVDLTRAMMKAWGDDKRAAVWTVGDILVRAAELGYPDKLSVDNARTILYYLIQDLEGLDGYDTLDQLIYNEIVGCDGDDE